jgi:hypothetical protein
MGNYPKDGLRAITDGVFGMTLDDHISKLMTCCNDVHCKREDSCFEVAKYAYEQRGLERLRQAQARVEGVEIPDEEIDYFMPPTWEAAR